MSTTVIFDSSKSPPSLPLPPTAPTPSFLPGKPKSGHPHTHPQQPRPPPPTPTQPTTTTTTTTPGPPPSLSQPRTRPPSPESAGSSTPDSSAHEQRHGSYRSMSKAEWLRFCRGIGVLRDEEGDKVVRFAGKLWPPRVFGDGLFRDVLYEKTKLAYYYHVLCVVCWALMLLQLVLGAVLTALGAAPGDHGTTITVIAAGNTCVAGILALLHNSGLPDRYRWNRDEFFKIEVYMKSIVDTGLVPAGQSVGDVLARCFEEFEGALRTVQKNTPAMWTAASSTRPVVPTAPSLPLPQQQQQRIVKLARKFDSEK